MIPYGRQQISEADIHEVESVLRSDFLTQGPVVPKFEAKFSELVGAAHSVAVNSATSALHLACLALDVGPGDEVWTTPNSFVASANCALYCGASVDFVDIEPDTLCMSVHLLEQKLRSHRARGKIIPKVVIPVHFAGQSCDMAAIGRLSREFGFRVIEDASHATGALYMGSAHKGFNPVGCCEFSDLSVFSFHPVKIITTGEGGLVTTNSKELAVKLQMLRTHGITRDPELFEASNTGPWHYEMQALGLNYRMTDVAAALGVSQLGRLGEFTSSRQRIATSYREAFANIRGIRLQSTPSFTQSANHLFVIHVNADIRRSLFLSLRAAGVGVNLHYIPITEHPFYKKLGFETRNYPNSLRHYEASMSLPIFPGLEEESIEHIVRHIEEFMSRR